MNLPDNCGPWRIEQVFGAEPEAYCDECGRLLEDPEAAWRDSDERLLCDRCAHCLEVCDKCMRVGELEIMTEVDGLWLCPDCVAESEKAE